MMKKIQANLRRLLLDDLYLYRHQELPVGVPLHMEGREDYYFKFRQDERKAFMKDLEQLFPLHDTRFCSIGCGFAGEEYLIKDKVKKLVLIEPDPVCIRFIERKFGGKTFLFPGYMQDFDAREEYEIIYTSGPSNWMYSSPFNGMPDCFVEFLKKYLEPRGVFIARLYGGLHRTQVIESNYFVKVLQKQLAAKGFPILQYLLNERNAFLVAAGQAVSPELRDMAFASEGSTYYIKGGQFLGNKVRTDLRKRAARMAKLSLFIPSRIAWGVLKVLRESYNDALVNARL